MSFNKNIGKNLTSKYGQKPLNQSKTYATTDVISTASKRAIQKLAEVTGNLIGNKIEDKPKLTEIPKDSKFEEK